MRDGGVFLMSPWVVLLTAEDGTVSVVGPFGAKHRAENWADSVDGEAQAVMLESAAAARAELAEQDRWVPLTRAQRRVRSAAL